MSHIAIVEAVTPDHLAQVAALMRDYLLWMRRRYSSQAEMIDGYFDEREWESELADLAGHYGAPFGAIVLALVDGVPAGCVMLRGIGEQVGEIKRLFVRPAFQGHGVACALVAEVAKLALARGYATIRLETGPRQFEAQALYRSVGFARVAPYYDVVGWFKDNMQFFEAPARNVACRPRRTHRQSAIAA